MDKYVVTVWDKEAQDPYYKVEHGEMETAQHVARSLQRHYIDEWGGHAASAYEIRLQKIGVTNE